MTDITNEVLTYLKNNLEDVSVTSPYNVTNKSFPKVTVYQNSDVMNTAYIDSSGSNVDNISLIINIFDNSSSKETVVKEVRDKVNSLIESRFRLIRTQSYNIENYIDNDVYRWLLTYTASIDKNKVIYRR